MGAASPARGSGPLDRRRRRLGRPPDAGTAALFDSARSPSRAGTVTPQGYFEKAVLLSRGRGHAVGHREGMIKSITAVDICEASALGVG